MPKRRIPRKGSNPVKKVSIVKNRWQRKKAKRAWRRRHTPLVGKTKYTKYRFVNSFPVNFVNGTGWNKSERVVTFNRFNLGVLGADANYWP